MDDDATAVSEAGVARVVLEGTVVVVVSPVIPRLLPFITRRSALVLRQYHRCYLTCLVVQLHRRRLDRLFHHSDDQAHLPVCMPGVPAGCP